ncbi:hypothetical protein RB195_002732 [Necator americanus]|uniref:Reverse transcriptase domain-containing protein n=1 Tax=Necator americanus TaxID=51031 RepID=A0ABR1DKN2_NECAM
MPLCFTFINLMKAFDSVETEAPKLRRSWKPWPTEASPLKKPNLQVRWVSDVPFKFNGTKISERTSYVYLSREMSMMNDLTPELGGRRRAVWGAYKNIEDVVKKTKNTRLRAPSPLYFTSSTLPYLLL